MKNSVRKDLPISAYERWQRSIMSTQANNTPFFTAHAAGGHIQKRNSHVNLQKCKDKYYKLINMEVQTGGVQSCGTETDNDQIKHAHEPRREIRHGPPPRPSKFKVPQSTLFVTCTTVCSLHHVCFTLLASVKQEATSLFRSHDFDQSIRCSSTSIRMSHLAG
jgi:hypothetical protein